MSEPIPGLTYYYDHTAVAFCAPGRPSLVLAQNPDAVYRPIALPEGATDAEIRSAFGVPAGANLVRWTFGSSDLETVFASLGSNDILVLPERPEPYVIDSSKGFMAAGVAGIDGTDSAGKVLRTTASRIPITSNPRLWFEMCRARRGIIGLGPGAVIEPSNSGWTQQAQPILEDQASGQEYQNVYYASGAVGRLVGAQNTLIGYDHATPFFANFTIRGRTFGGVAYSAIKPTGGSQTLNTFKRINFDKCWRSHEGVPNAETGCLTLNGGAYLIENCEITPPTDSVSGGSCIMWNNNTGGTVRNVRANVTSLPSNLGGMWTFWRCGGVNTFIDVHIRARQSGMNIEESKAGFELDWTGGVFTVDYPGNRFHFVMNPVGGPPKITLRGVTVSPNAYTPGALTLNNYGTNSGSRALISCDTVPVSCVPSSKWTA